MRSTTCCRAARRFFLFLIAPLLVLSAGCGRREFKAGRVHVDARAPGMLAGGAATEPGHNTEEYEYRTDNPWRLARHEPLSTFSIDVDTASYSNVRRFLDEGRLPPRDAVRVEEFINYFRYDYPQPDGEHPIALNAEVAACPWNPERRLVRVGLQARTVERDQMPPRNLVFLVDTSGSMNAWNRLPLLRESLRLLALQLNPADRVAIVAYAGSAGVVLPPTPGDQFEAIAAALDRLQAGGSTNGGAGIQLAYDLAEQAFLKEGVNRVIIGTDGDFNVGVTGTDLVRLIEQKRDTGILLSVLGFGRGNLKDATMEKLAHHGNGQYAYVDSPRESHRVFVEQLASLVPAARDVKVQVEFNPRLVKAYRLVGYENRLLNHQDFNDDRKDAGDLGAGQAVTALYEVVPPGVQVDVPSIDPLRYRANGKPSAAARGDELLTVKVRYLPNEGAASRLLAAPVADAARGADVASPDFRFASAVASFGMLLRDSPYKGRSSYDEVLRLARSAQARDPDGQRAEFVQLVQRAQRLDVRPPQVRPRD